ncbi:hypothetical protein SLEP1_g4759 [Rubroshorea leprosula]|uniref:Uncharacterized protein n=1 Tax=Rubroshorea leprosula TaxID=152421 RepID=A0AAV5HYK2_9ROSI|nr:hypothetical protein SLEP1_g4759 [Rubroshorea leprosula]
MTSARIPKALIFAPKPCTTTCDMLYTFSNMGFSPLSAHRNLVSVSLFPKLVCWSNPSPIKVNFELAREKEMDNWRQL